MQNKKLSFLGTALNRSSLKSITGGIIQEFGKSVVDCSKKNPDRKGTVTCYGANCSGNENVGCSCSSYTSGGAKSCLTDTWD